MINIPCGKCGSVNIRKNGMTVGTDEVRSSVGFVEDRRYNKSDFIIANS